MRRVVEGADREQSTLFPECLEDWIGEDNPVRVIDVFVDELDLAGLGCHSAWGPDADRRHNLCVPKIRFCNIGGEGHRELGCAVMAPRRSIARWKGNIDLIMSPHDPQDVRAFVGLSDRLDHFPSLLSA